MRFVDLPAKNYNEIVVTLVKQGWTAKQLTSLANYKVTRQRDGDVMFDGPGHHFGLSKWDLQGITYEQYEKMQKRKK